MSTKRSPKTVKSAQVKNYKRNFLKTVLLRIDYPITSLDFLTKFSKKIQTKFPINEQVESTGTSVIIRDGKIEQNQQKLIVWNFFDAKKTKKLEIAEDHLFIEYSKYKNSEELLTDVKDVVNDFIELSKIESINRIGLRYTNEIDLKEIKEVIDWSKYFNKNLLGSIFFGGRTKPKLARAIGRLVIKESIADINFTFGIWNSDFPNANVRKEFMLDFDCYSRLPAATAEFNFIELIKTYNQYIENLFEASITDNFRSLLNKTKK